MGERPYSDEDIELVAEASSAAAGDDAFTEACRGKWHHEPQRQMYRKRATHALDALAGAGRLRPTGAERFQLGDLAATDTKVGGRIEGRVIRLADDGMVTIAVPQGALVPPMEVTAPAREFARVDALEVTESFRGQLDPDTVRDLAALAGYELGRSDERAELERAGRLLPADVKTRTEYGIQWPAPWPESGGSLSPESAHRYATDSTVEKPGTEVERTIWTGPWRPVSSEDTGEATDAHQP